MKIYTKTGDEGETGLFGGGRVRKDHARIEAYGTVDELNAALGTARGEALQNDLDQALRQIQNDLFDLGAELATPHAEILKTRVGSEQIQQLEQWIDAWETELPPLKTFILPGGLRAAGELHLARTICRRAERCVVRLAEITEQPISAEIGIYLNRLSDLLFVAARLVNQRGGRGDELWEKRNSTL
jgi:cob(I)alamin adenosyltransferase